MLALLPLLAARGLLGRRAAGAAARRVITQLMALPVAYNLLQADGVGHSGPGIALAVVAVAALVLLVNPETTRALGIRGPGNVQK
ncbi:hypothetical protein SVIOM74S_07392 [Streptomyces violarus]